MKTAERKERVLWAVDPFTENKALQFATFRALAKLTGGSDTAIEPVAVLSPEQMKVPAAALRDGKKEYLLEAEKILKSWIKTLKDPRLTLPTLLAQDIYSTHVTLDVLLRYAREAGASLIAVGTHNKKGFERFFVGSFAETLILKSEIPILVVNPKGPAVKKISRILFPTDFSENSKEAFLKVVSLAKALKAKVTLYYKFEYVLPTTIDAMGLTPQYSQYLHDDMETRRRTAIQWVERATQSGVKVDVVLDEKPFYVADGIMKVAKKTKADLIALASHSGAFATAVIGSVARQVVRLSPLPVWVIHPPKRDTKKLGESTGTAERFQTARS